MHISLDKRIQTTFSGFPVNRWRKSPRLTKSSARYRSIRDRSEKTQGNNGDYVAH